MADYYTVLNKAIAALAENTGEARRLVYDRARKALVRQLEAIDPPLSPSDITRQRLSLEEAIRSVEAEQASTALGLPTLTPDATSSAAPASAQIRPTPSTARSAHPAEGEPPATSSAPDTDEGIAGSATGTGATDFAPNPLTDLPQTANQGMTAPPAENVSVNAFRRAVNEASDLPNRAGEAAATARSVITGETGAQAARTEPRFSVQSPLPPTGIAGKEASQVDPNERPEPDVNEVLEAKSGPYDDPEIGRMIDQPRGSSAVKKALLFGGAALLLVLIAGGAVLFFSLQTNLPDLRGGQEVASVEESAAAVDRVSSGEQEGGATDPSRVAPDAERVATRPVETPELAEQAADSSQLTESPAPGEAPSVNAAIPNSQRAILYEETDDPALNNTIAVSGSVVWRERQNPAAPASRIADVEITIPERDFSMTMVLRENLDPAVEASNIFEVSFDMPDDYKGGSVTEIPGLILKSTENARGDLLIGTEVRIATNLFWLALSGLPADITANRTLLRDREWIDLPLKFDNGQRGLIAFEKGGSGGRAIESVVNSWSATEPQ